MKRPGQATMNGRPGRRDKATKVIEMLRRASCETNRFTIGGREKTGHNKPRPITLAKLKFNGEI